MHISTGSPSPLGATWDGHGVNFAIFSEHATHVELCLFDSPDAASESERVVLPAQTDSVWHGYVSGVRPGRLYSYRVHGPWDPAAGHRFNPTKVVLDPYAKAIGRSLVWHDALGAQRAGSDDPYAINTTDSAPYAPLAAVLDPTFAWEDDAAPRIPWHETVIYELHVKGFSIANDAVPEAMRGTYLGLASEPSIRHLKQLGVTTVELMPVHHRADEERLVERGLVNYWGYNTLAYFAPDRRFASPGAPGNAVHEFKMMVRALHAAGLEVILDVVYNHTAEGDHRGPTLSLRGVDNANYYRLAPEDRARYEDFTGCGDTVDTRVPCTRQLIVESLRYWVEDMHVDGFRFDLAPALARGTEHVDRLAEFFDMIGHDPVLSRVKLIAEPWDAAAGGYQLGNFPAGWNEWNGRYRDTVRRFWRGDDAMLPELATRLAGSSDLYDHDGRLPQASINFVTVHDGFTLADLVAYNNKHNDANGENNRDGENHNLSWNCGVEGPTDDPAILALRLRQRRNFLLTLFVSQGVPMISGGDELGRTQRGNNNAYCHDDELSWTHWNADRDDAEFCGFVRRLIALRASAPVLRRQTFLSGRGPHADVLWYSRDGREMTSEDWDRPDGRTVGVLFNGDVASHEARDRNASGQTLLILLNASAGDVIFHLPVWRKAGDWRLAVDTADACGREDHVSVGDAWTLATRSAAVFVWEK